jgi:hypothetical protein
MRHLLTGIAIIAAFAIAASASAQRTGPGPYANTGTGPGVTPPGGFGPSSPLFNLPDGSTVMPGAAPFGMAPRPASVTTPPAPSGVMAPVVSPQSH